MRSARPSSAIGWLALSAVLGAGCAEPAQTRHADLSATAASAPTGQAQQLLATSAPLPARARVVALSNQLSIAAAELSGAERHHHLMLAAQLRERLWRLDHRDTDLREALELYGQLTRQALGTPIGCRADHSQLLLAAEGSHDPSALYRGLYLAIERQDAALEEPAARDSCLPALSSALERVSSYRPSGLSWQQLRADAEAQRQRAKVAARPVPSSTAARIASAVASGTASGAGVAPPPELARGRVPDMVVHPDAAMLAKGDVKLTEARPYSWELGGRLVLSLSGAADYRLGRLAPDPAAGRGHRLYIDLPGVRMNKRMKEISDDGLIQRVRFGKRKDGTRVVLDLAAAAYRRVFYLPKPFRVVIDVGSRSAVRKAPIATAPVPVGQPKPKQPASERAVTRITLDPGHGGWDSGAVGPTGLQEKDVALDIAHRAAPALATELKIETMLSRDTDVYVPLEERTARANAFQSDLFISIHCNATESGEAQGVEIYVLDPSKEADPHAAELMARENRGGHKLPATGMGAHITTIAAGLDVGDNARQSRVIAELLRRSTLASVSGRYPNMKDHGVKTAGFFVLLGSEMPATLFETAFISNPRDEARLATADFRQKLADAIVNAVKAYRDGLR